MSITRQIELAVGSALILLILSLWGYGAWKSRLAASLKDENQVLNADATADTTYVREYKRAVIEEKRANERVESAIRRNPVWADEPLPDDVADILRDPEATAD